MGWSRVGLRSLLARGKGFIIYVLGVYKDYIIHARFEFSSTTVKALGHIIWHGEGGGGGEGGRGRLQVVLIL